MFCCRTKYCTKSLPSAVEAIKLKANAAFEQEKYNQAIKLYNQALSMCADQPVLYGNRAAAYLKRSWLVIVRCLLCSFVNKVYHSRAFFNRLLKFNFSFGEVD